jgi:hypothetical protein
MQNASSAELRHRDNRWFYWILEEVVHVQVKGVKGHQGESIVLAEVAFVGPAGFIQVTQT